MAWAYNDTTREIGMAEEDFGVALPFTITGATVSQQDEFVLQINRQQNGDGVLTKVYPANGNGFNLIITQEESERLKPGAYAYYLDWKQTGVFNYNLICNGIFRVGDKA